MGLSTLGRLQLTLMSKTYEPRGRTHTFGYIIAADAGFLQNLFLVEVPAGDYSDRIGEKIDGVRYDLRDDHKDAVIFFNYDKAVDIAEQLQEKTDMNIRIVQLIGNML